MSLENRHEVTGLTVKQISVILKNTENSLLFPILDEIYYFCSEIEVRFLKRLRTKNFTTLPYGRDLKLMCK